MTSQKQITDFLANDLIAMAGVSRNPKKFGFTSFKELRGKGLNLIPVNPNADEIDGVKTYRTISELPKDVDALLIMTKKDKTLSVIKEAKDRGIKNIWIQQMSETPEVLAELEGLDLNIITKQCIMMYYEPHSIHKFHHGLKKFFGGLPK